MLEVYVVVKNIHLKQRCSQGRVEKITFYPALLRAGWCVRQGRAGQGRQKKMRQGAGQGRVTQEQGRAGQGVCLYPANLNVIC